MGNMTTSNTAGAARPKATKQMACKYCGQPMTVGMRKRVAPHHMECGIRESVKSIQQIAARSGPYYDKMMEAHRRNPGGRPRGGGVSRETTPTPNENP